MGCNNRDSSSRDLYINNDFISNSLKLKTTIQCCLTSTHVPLDLGVIYKLQTFWIQNLELLHTRMIG